MEKVRGNVRITQYQANMLNDGVIHGANVGLVALYCPAGYVGDITADM